MTRLGEALEKRLRNQPRPLVTSYELFRRLWEIYEEGSVKYLRGNTPSQNVFHRTRDLLRTEGVIQKDHDYPRVWRVTAHSDIPADEVVCLVDRYCYISHLSAMQRYGLSERRPEGGFVTTWLSFGSWPIGQ